MSRNTSLSVPIIRPDCRTYVDLIWLALLLTWVAWNTGLRLLPGWTADDGVHLRFASVYSIREYLFNPALLHVASYANLTPTLHLFYSFNLLQFGMDSAAWRATLSVISVFTVASLYGAASQYMRPKLALFVCGAWALSVPFYYTTATFMTSHYLVGMLFSCLCVWMFAHWMRRNNIGYLAGAVFFYALASFSKEVFLPLPALLLLHRPRTRALWGIAPMAVVIALYLAARHAVLGSLVGGYRSGQYINLSDLNFVLERISQLPIILWGGTWQAAIFGIVFLALAWQTFRALWLLFVVAAIVVMLPLLPLIAASSLSEPDRYFFVPSAMTLFLLGAMLETQLRQHRLASWLTPVSCLAVGLVLMQQHITRVPALITGLDTQATIYNHVLANDAPSLILNPELPADNSYWSSVLNSARESQARLNHRFWHNKVMMVGDPQSPILFGLHRRGVAIYRFDKDNCQCLKPYTPAGPPNLNASGLASRKIHVLHRESRQLHPENNMLAWGESVQSLRRISPEDPLTLEIAGHINLSTEQEWIYLFLPFAEKPAVEASEPAQVVTTEQGAHLRPFHLRLRFATPQHATNAQAQLCIAVPAILQSAYALLQGQPGYCNVLVNHTLRPSE